MSAVAREAARAEKRKTIAEAGKAVAESEAAPWARLAEGLNAIDRGTLETDSEVAPHANALAHKALASAADHVANVLNIEGDWRVLVTTDADASPQWEPDRRRAEGTSPSSCDTTAGGKRRDLPAEQLPLSNFSWHGGWTDEQSSGWGGRTKWVERSSVRFGVQRGEHCWDGSLKRSSLLASGFRSELWSYGEDIVRFLQIEWRLPFRTLSSHPATTSRSAALTITRIEVAAMLPTSSRMDRM